MSTNDNGNPLLDSLVREMDEESVKRLEAEDEELRAISPTIGALGLNFSDYRNMYNLFMNVLEPAMSMKERGFTARGEFDIELIKAYNSMMGTAIKALSEINKMRNQDKMTAMLLDEHTKTFAQDVSKSLAMAIVELRNEVAKGDSDPEDIVFMLDELIKQKLPKIFMQSAVGVLAEVKETYGLVN